MDLATTYPIEWYRERLAERGGPHDSNIRLAELTVQEFAPISVIDLGAATCSFVNRVSELGVPATAVDHLPQCAEFARNCYFVVHDLQLPLVLYDTFDLVTCWEVIEHLPEEAETAIVTSIVRLAKRWVVLSISSVTDGYEHLNVKPRAYWLDVFEQAGLVYEAERTKRFAGVIAADPLVPCAWFSQNLSVWSAK